MYADDTIAAIATPPGQGGVGIVRVSGPLCRQIAETVFARTAASTTWRSRHLYHGRIIDEDGAVVDEGLAVLMPQPHSFTGEDVLELHCHGSPTALRCVLKRVLSGGARVADPGEFTKRAFLNGRLDLAQAEAVIDLVRAQTDVAAALASEQLTGRLSACLSDLRAQLVHLKAMVETQIDFSEEEIDVRHDELVTLAMHCKTGVEVLINTYKHGLLIRDGVRVAIVGKPNVGKSSLLNALLGEDRAIVTPIAGTTRDSIDETADFEGIPVVLSDTAGLRELAHADTVERLGIERTSTKISEANLLLTVFDASAAIDAEDYTVLTTTTGLPRIIVLNKIDLGASPDAVRSLDLGDPVVLISVTERRGLADLRRAVVGHFTQGRNVERTGPVLTNLRHHDALTKTKASLELARESLCVGHPPDIVAVDIQDAIDHVGEITGAVTSEDILDRIFSEFCIGK